MSKTYQATVTREGHWWMVKLNEFDGLTQARRLSEAELMARELVATHFEIPLEEVSVTITVEKVDDVDVIHEVEGIKQQRRQAAEIEQQALKRSADLAKALAERKVPVRDIGTALGVSFQRAHQLIKAA